MTATVEDALESYVHDLNAAVSHRDFASVFDSWFAADGRLTFRHTAVGLDKVRRMWEQLIPTREEIRREVLQHPYAVEKRVVRSWRQLQGGSLSRPLYGLQDTRFDEHSLIDDIVITSVDARPEVNADRAATEGRLGRIFLQFADVFNTYFQTGNAEPLLEWCAPDISTVLVNSLRGPAVAQHYERIPPGTMLVLDEHEQVDPDRVRATVGYVTKGARYGGTTSEFVFDGDRRLRDVVLDLRDV